MKKIYVDALEKYIGTTLSDTFYVSDIVRNQNRQGTKWCTVRLSDRTGSFVAKIWSEFTEEQIESVEEKVCMVTGTVDIYNGVTGLAITSMVEQDSYQGEEYVRGITYEEKTCYLQKLDEFIEECAAPYHYLLKKVFTKTMRELYSQFPAGEYLHHAYAGGLLVHTVEVTKCARTLAEQVPNVNVDLLIAGALLHDVGKIKEYKAQPHKGRTVRGQLVGHLVDGAILINWYNNKLPATERFDTTELTHCVLGSHGDFGGIRPSTKEAILLHQADRISSRMNGFESAFQKEEERRGGGTKPFVYSAMHETMLYKGGKQDV